MGTSKVIFLFLGVVLFAPRPLFATTRLGLFGGDAYPPEASHRFVEWAGGSKAVILVVGWASEDPRDYVRTCVVNLRKDFEGVQVIQAIPPSEAIQYPERFLKQLSSASAVFFTGGDQTDLMNVINRAKLGEAFRGAYRRGMPLGGTSAGTAVMSLTMLTGNGSDFELKAGVAETSTGLGILTDLVVDQHFIVRKRLVRLLSVLLDSRESIGLGVDEGTAALVTDEDRVEVTGRGEVVVFKREASKNTFTTYIANSGESFSLSDFR